MNSDSKAKKIKTDYAIIVEGRDDVAAVSLAVDALLIPTHGFGISAETWKVIEKAYDEKGIIILTDPDHAGEAIRRRLTEKFPEAIQAYVARSDASTAHDIGIENARPEAIAEAIERALAIRDKLQSEGESKATSEADESGRIVYADASDLLHLGLAGCDGAAEQRATVAGSLGIGYGNASAFLKKLRGFGIGLNELKEEVEKIRKKE